MNPDKEQIVDNIVQNEVKYEASRSSGAGGQHVNKTESRIQLFWNFAESSLDEAIKARFEQKHKNKINGEGIFVIDCQVHRSQHKNKELVNEKFKTYILQCLEEPKKRKKTNIPKAAQEKRLASKKHASSIKKYRGKPGLE